MFKSKKEFIEALVSGRKFKTKFDKVIYYNSNVKGNPFFCKDSNVITPNVGASFDDYKDVIEIDKWYEDIPENGILCWLEYDSVVLVTHYNQVEDRFYANGVYYPFHLIKPLSEEEIKKFIDRVPL